MLTKLKLVNFKRFGEVEVDLGKSVVLIGPNNSGKTTVLQALALWDVGIRLWTAKRGGKSSPEKRPGVTPSTDVTSSQYRCHQPICSGANCMSEMSQK
jgi:recombinational DNA repair ATPase RecF